MIIFMIQTIDEQIPFDFSFQLVKNIKFQQSFHDADLQYCLIEYKNYRNSKGRNIERLKSYCKEYYGNNNIIIPIGSVEFVHIYMEEILNIKPPKPINIPECLFNFAGRNIVNIPFPVSPYVTTPINNFNSENIVIKSGDYLKRDLKVINKKNFYTEFINNKVLKDQFGDNLQISEYVADIESEWRAFVFNNELVGLQNYSGDFIKFPNIATIKKMINNYSDNSPVAYTLDIFINSKGQTHIMEIHNFYSCGLYGFDYPQLYKMFYGWFKQNVL